MSQHTPTIIPRSEHGISRTNISENALKVLHRLNKAGHAAYLVGGAVRDLLLGLHPKDFDIATDAHPEQVNELFRNCRLIGRRFRLAHIRYGREIIEVATFRAAHDDADEKQAGQTQEGRLLRDNVYGDLDSDAWRRDLTINALFYNIKDFSVVDYVGGMGDIHARQIRLIGDPETRYREDPVRMLRVLRFAAKLGFEIEHRTHAPITEFAPMLDEIPSARLYDEVLKLFHKGHALKSFEVLREHELLGYLFLQTEDNLHHDPDGYFQRMISHGLENTDKRVQSGDSVSPAFLYAFLLWGPLRDVLRADGERGINNISAIIVAAREVFAAQVEQTAIPRRLSMQTREIWSLQPRFEQRRGKRPLRLLSQPRFRAAYDFLLLRNQAGEDLQELCDWWTEFQTADDNQRHMVTKTPSRPKRRRRSSRRDDRTEASDI
ncbi:MAG: polynucleotide adenylyltransferase PcnB [Gammaproteobacteria bacterium]|nr:MAG: polynucleotide adenylyltransferase PcnB [Gammaproteobacteria bacterium]